MGSSKMSKIINIVCLALIGTAFADKGLPPTRKEAKQLFKKIDINGDRSLDLAELVNVFYADDAAEMMDSMDTNVDGKVNFNEFFKVMDGDENRLCGVFVPCAGGIWTYPWWRRNGW